MTSVQRERCVDSTDERAGRSGGTEQKERRAQSDETELGGRQQGRDVGGAGVDDGGDDVRERGAGREESAAVSLFPRRLLGNDLRGV